MISFEDKTKKMSNPIFWKKYENYDFLTISTGI